MEPMTEAGFRQLVRENKAEAVKCLLMSQYGTGEDPSWLDELVSVHTGDLRPMIEWNEDELAMVFLTF